MWLGGDRDPLWRAGPSWAFLGPLGLVAAPGGERGACRPRKGALRASERQCGRVFGGFRPAPRPFEDFPSRGLVPCWVFPWAAPSFWPESPAGPFSPPGGSQGKGPGGKGTHTGFLWPAGAHP